MRFIYKLCLSALLASAAVAAAQAPSIDPSSQIQWNLDSGTTLPACTQNGQYATLPYGAQWGQSFTLTTTSLSYVCSPTGWVPGAGSGTGTITPEPQYLLPCYTAAGSAETLGNCGNNPTTDASGDESVYGTLAAQNSYFLSSNLLHWNACLNLARNGGVCEIAYSGDSWPGFYLAEPLSDQLRGTLGDGGIGYVSFNYQASTHPVDVSVFSPSGTWTLCAQTASCVGIDASDQTSSGTAGWTITAPFSVYVWHYYQQSGGGTLTWTVDGGTSCGALGSATCSGTVNTSGTASPQIATFGPYTYGVHTVVLSATNNTRMMGQKLISGNPGIIVDNVGSSGIKATGYTQLTAAIWEADWVNLLGTAQPTLVVDTLGTNDQTAAVVPATFGTQMSTIITEIQTAVPLADVLLSTNTSQDLSSTYPTSQYVTTQLGLVSSTVGVLNNYALFPGYTAAVSIGLMWPNGNVHPAGPGAVQIVGNISGYLLGNRVKTLGDGSLGDTYYRAGINGNMRIQSCSLRGANLFTGTWAYLGTGFSYSAPTLTATSVASGGPGAASTYMTLVPGNTYLLTFNATLSAGAFQPEINAISSPSQLLGPIIYQGVPYTTFSIPFTVPYNYGTFPELTFASNYGVGPTNPLTGTISNISVTQCLGGDLLVNGNETTNGNSTTQGNATIVGNLIVDGTITNAGSGLPVTISKPGDIICSKAADPEAGAQTVSTVSSNASTLSYVMTAALPGFMLAPGMPIQCQGNTTGGYNGSPTSGSGTWTINAATAGSTLVLNSTANPGAGTGGGTCSLVCGNQTLDAATNFITFASSYTLPANMAGTSVFSIKVRPQMGIFSSAGAASIQRFAWQLSPVYPLQNNGTTFTPSNNLANAPATYPIDITFPVAYPNTAFATIPPFSLGAATALAETQGLTGAARPPLVFNPTFALPITLIPKYTATGLASVNITGIGGCTVTGTSGQTVLLTAFNNSSTATATVTLNNTVAAGALSSSNVGSITVTNPGHGATAAPTSATCSAGTATSATGTASFTSVLGGSWGDFIIMWSMTFTN